MSRSPRAFVTVLALTLGWLLAAVPIAGLVFVNSERSTVLAGHDAVVRPTFDGWAEVRLGPVLPSFRYPSGRRLGAEVELGRTTLTSYDDLVRRYALLATQPQGQIAKVEAAVRDMALTAALLGGLAGLALPGSWLLLGARRRREIVHSRTALVALGAAGTATIVAASLLVVRPWATTDSYGDAEWRPVATVFPEVPVPPEARPLEVDTGLLTLGAERLVTSALDSYRRSSTFYTDAAEAATALAGQIRQPQQDETVAVLVSDRHDNIGMDRVARAIADAGGASVLLDAGDDTSTGSSWEAFSLESLDVAFADYEHRWYVAGNHDHGGFVIDQAERLGFTPLDGEVVEGPDGIRLLGAHDPRSSGLGNWRDETGLSFDEVAARVADAACAESQEGEPVSTLLVHDRNLGRPALERGCVDLVLSGHLHVVDGPDPVGAGYSYTTGTTGGAAYAIAIGTKPRRDATVSLVTYRDGLPVGVQWVSLSSLGDFTVGPYESLDRNEADPTS